jgi:murein DD-endopeptidase MepM/ murein hydrolase activator NlpD
MRRLLGVAAVAASVALGASGVVVADDQDDSSVVPTTTPDDTASSSLPTALPTTTAPPSTSPPPPATEPPPTTEVSSTTTTTTSPTTATSTTTTTTAPARPRTPPPPTTTTTTTTTTATATAPARPRTPPPPTTTTVPETTTTATDQPDDHQLAEPPAPPVETPSGRVVVPSGAVETGEVRSITFPVAGPVTYVNDFGACRDGCSRAHQGNDLIGDRLQPLLAMHDGVIDHLVDHPTAGYGVVIRDTAGWEYRVYHVNNDSPGTDDGAEVGAWRYAQGITPGVTVRAGQLIGWTGDSGNSEGSVPHAHVEIHRPDGVAINPFWSLRAAQRDVNCSIETVRRTSVRPSDPTWFEHGWGSAPLPAGWRPLRLTGGHPGSATVAARMWVATTGYTPVDAAALRVGDPRYDEGVDCMHVPATTRIPSELGAVLAAIRAIESGGDYTAESATSSASGAYQFIDSSWGGYGGYGRASHAPPAVQDAKAAEWASAILARNGGDVSTVPVTWYLGHVPVGAEWDTVPPQAGNVLTPREYHDRWMQEYAALVGRPDAWKRAAPDRSAVDISQVCHTVVVDLGSPDAPRYVLTQAQRFAAEPMGRAVPTRVDPCDPARPAPAPPPMTVDVATPVRTRGGLGKG